MKIYSSKYLNIEFNEKKDLFVQNWAEGVDISIIAFKIEMLEYVKLYEKFKPKNTLWNQEDFRLVLDNEMHNWIEEFVNIPCKSFGNEKCAFVVGAHVMAHITVMDSFDGIESCIIPKHFGSTQDAMNWILEHDEIETREFEVSFQGKNEAGLNEFVLRTSSNQIQDVLKDIKSIVAENQFVRENTNKFVSLTNRELEIFKLYGQGVSIKNIATQIHISELTLRTHWRNIKRKLEIENVSDIHQYIHAFL